MIKKILLAILLLPTLFYAQINTERVMTIARNALYFEDYVLSIPIFQSGNQREALFIRALFLPCAGKNQPGRFSGRKRIAIRLFSAILLL